MKKWMWIGFAFSLFFLGGCQEERTEDPMAPFYAYQKAFQEQDFGGMYDALDTESRIQWTKEDYRTLYESIYGPGAVTETSLEPRMEIFDIEKRMQTEESMKIPVNLSLKKGDEEIRYSFDVTLVKERNTEDTVSYRLKFHPLLVYRNFALGDRVEERQSLPKRGEIFDRNGKGLAVNGELLWVGLVPGRMDNREKTITALSDALGLSTSFIERRLSLSWVKPDTFVDMRRVSLEEKGKLDTLKAAYPGITYRVIEGRVYPYKEALAHLLGYVSLVSAEEYKELEPLGFPVDTRVGRAGLEALYEEDLRGSLTSVAYLVDESGAVKELLSASGEAKGKDLNLNIDVDMQLALYQALSGERGTGSIVNYKTGEVLALVNAPSYDPNGFVLGLSQDAYRALESDPANPLLNRYTRLYAPGSLVKPITAAIALDRSGFDPSFTIDGQGMTWQKNTTWGNYFVRRIYAPQTPVNLEDAMIYSDNIYFARMALDTGAAALIEGLKAFGFSEEDASGLGFLKSQIAEGEDLSNEIRLADTGYGQGQMLVHALTLPKAYTALADQGLMKELMIVKEDRLAKETAVISAETAETVLSDLRKVVRDERGSAYSLNLPDRSFAGKTGTSEVGRGESYRQLGWFSAIEESAENPYITTMMVEDVADRGMSRLVVEKMRPVLLTYGK